MRRHGLEERYRTLPATFEAYDLDKSGISGGRRHLLVRFFAEHLAFPCELVARQPLTAHEDESREVERANGRTGRRANEEREAD